MKNNLTPETFALTPEAYVVYYHGELAGIHIVQFRSGPVAFDQKEAETLTPLPGNFESILSTALENARDKQVEAFCEGMEFALWLWRLHSKD